MDGRGAHLRPSTHAHRRKQYSAVKNTVDKMSSTHAPGEPSAMVVWLTSGSWLPPPGLSLPLAFANSSSYACMYTAAYRTLVAMKLTLMTSKTMLGT